MPRVLFLANIARFFTDFLLPFADHFRKQGWQVDAAASEMSTCTGCLAHFDQTFDLEWTRNPLDTQNFLGGLRQVRDLIVHGGYDLIHIHTPVSAFIARLALRGVPLNQRPKIIYTVHGYHFHKRGHPLKNLVFLSIEKLAGPWTDYLVVINREDEQATRRYNIVPPSHLRYMPGIGIDLSRNSADMVSGEGIRAVRAELGLSEGQPLFVMIAEYDPEKRHRDALQALTQLNEIRGHKDAVLALAGVGKLIEQVRAQARELGLESQVKILGWRRDVPTLIRASVATVLPSEREGLPRAVMESLALETPVIGCDIRGVQELLEDGCGILTKVGDTPAIAQAMTWMIEHPQEAALMGQKGRQRMAAYDLKNILRLHQE
ncbi:MAG: glycosyltransferase, partial [Thermaceae bacterium]|nr:glycosyltransferase [Thermaceae bacterium]